MTDRLLVIDALGEERTAAALLVGGRLEDLLIDPPAEDPTPRPGEIFLAKVDRLVPGMGAAFLLLGADRTAPKGFLRGAKGLREGQTLLVQVVSYAEPGKASPVTQRLLYKDRIVIHTPGAPGLNISRQIRERETREALTAELAAVVGEAQRSGAWPAEWLESGGIILRSAAATATREDLAASLQSVMDRRQRVEAEATDQRPPRRLHKSSAAIEAVREWSWPLPEKLEIQSGVSPAQLQLGGDLAALAQPSTARGFERHGVFEAADLLCQPRAPLSAGGWMAIEATSALVAVDVNTAGNFSGGDALTANIEAARDLPRQLRLRGLGGIVAVDFAPIAKRDRKRVEETLKAAFKRDPIETTIAGWTPLGLMELQRKRERRPIASLS